MCYIPPVSSFPVYVCGWDTCLFSVSAHMRLSTLKRGVRRKAEKKRISFSSSILLYRICRAEAKSHM